LLCLCALVLSLFLMTAISMFLYSLTLVTLTPAGVNIIVIVTAEFFAGLFIPIPFMPLVLQRILYFLPFRYTADLPFRIYSGSIPVNEAIWGICVQIIWIIGLIFIGYRIFGKIMRRVVIQGG
jgi:ABC-2 type transport system permease protein